MRARLFRTAVDRLRIYTTGPRPEPPKEQRSVAKQSKSAAQKHVTDL